MSWSLINTANFVKILSIRGVLSLSVTESGGDEKSAQVSGDVAEDYS
ncbi:hypothetical protein ACVRWQ_00675 [Streptococcus phocae subsp. salmonis]|nr:hypothetical protein [Streptococcus phocae]